jgi:hypothetical protein
MKQYRYLVTTIREIVSCSSFTICLSLKYYVTVLFRIICWCSYGGSQGCCTTSSHTRLFMIILVALNSLLLRSLPASHLPGIPATSSVPHFALCILTIFESKHRVLNKQLPSPWSLELRIFRYYRYIPGRLYPDFIHPESQFALCILTTFKNK